MGFINSISPFEKFPILAVTFIPIFLFFFQNSIENRNIRSRDFFHVILPVIFIFLSSIIEFPMLLSKIIFTTITLVYWSLILRLLINHYKKIILIYSFNRVNFRWLVLIFINMTLITFYLNYLTIYWNSIQAGLSLTNFYRATSILWTIALLYLILNPIIIYGKDFLLYQLTMKTNLYNPWTYKLIMKVRSKDLLIKKKLENLTPEIIYSLKKLEEGSDLLSMGEINLKALSERLNIPISNLKFIFKHHCKLSVHEYLNLLKISLAIQHIKQGFLNKKTVDSLSNESHFDSRITFYKNFKKFTGKNPSEFGGI